MKTKIIEATNGFNHGKFLLGQFDHELGRRSALPVDQQHTEEDLVHLAKVGVAPQPYLLLQPRWERGTLLVLDLETGEGALFRPGGLAAADLHKHQIWVCPLFEPFLTWLYAWAGSVGRLDGRLPIDALPDLVELPDAPSALYGYRRPGPRS